MNLDISKDKINSLLAPEINLDNTTELHRILANESPVAISIMDEARYIYVNNAMLSLTGYEQDEMLSWTPKVGEETLLFEEDINATKHISTDFSAQFIGNEMRLRRKDGSYRWVNYYSYPLSADKPFPIATVAVDITKHKRDNEFYRESQRIIQRISETSPHISYVYDINDRRYIYTNRRLQDDLGYSQAQAIEMGKTFPECKIHPDDQLKRETSLQKWKSDTMLESQCEDYRVRDVQGEWRWLELNETIFEQDADGNVAQLIGSLQDITPRKKYEESLKHRIAFESLIVDISSRFINLKSEDIDNHIHEALEEVALFIGMESGHVALFDESLSIRRVTHNWRHVNLPPLPDKFIVANTDTVPWLVTQLKENVHVAISNTQELPVEAIKEKDFYTALNIYTVIEVPLTYQGELVGYMGFSSTIPTRTWTSDELQHLSFLGRVIIDILKLKEAAIRRQELENQIRQSQKLESLGVLAGGIAHDFNNILVPIIAFTDLSMHTLSESDPLYYQLDEVKKAGNRAKDLIRQIMAFSRQSGTDRHALNPVHVVKETLPLLRASFPSTIEIKDSIMPKCGFIYANPSELHRIVMNLSTNAFHAMEENGGTLTIQLEPVVIDEKLAQQRPNLNFGETYVKMTLSDTGTGIKPEIVNRIFDPFFTTKDDDKGTGLGLAAVHGVVQELSGDILVTSEPDTGTTFQVFIPEYRENVQPVKEPDKLDVLGRGEHILIVDDELNILKVEKSVLLNSGYQTSAFNDSTEAYNAFRNNPNDYDLILADQTMPRLTGLKLASDIRKIRADIPIILCSGLLDDFTFKQTQILKRCFVVHKPFSSVELAKTVRHALDSTDS